jgi:hypothetical protein
VTAETSKKILRITGVVPPPPPQTPDTGNTGNPGNTGDPGQPGVTPDTAAPAVTRGKVNARTRKLSLRLNEPAALRAVVQQKVRRGKKRVWKRVRGPLNKPGKAGTNSIALGRKFKAGSYRAVVTATDFSGNKTTARIGFRVR